MAERMLVQHTSAGEPITVGDLKVFPVARSYRMNFAGDRGGMLWNRPLGVIVEDQNGNRQTIPVQDKTRRMQVTILAAGFLGTLLAWMVLQRSK